jgi:hypothetical protein
MSIQLNRHQAELLLSFFDSGDFDDVVLEVEFHEVGPHGPGLYCWHAEYPEEGKSFLPSVSEAVKQCEKIVADTSN